MEVINTFPFCRKQLKAASNNLNFSVLNEERQIMHLAQALSNIRRQSGIHVI